jgi:hypothetical protein
LQEGKPANDVLLYFPLDDLFQTPKDLLIPLTVHNFETTMVPHPFYSTAMMLLNRGYGFDFVSDRFLASAQCVGGKVIVGGNVYRAVVVPKCKVMSETTIRTLAQLAKAGAVIVFQDHVPEDVPGFGILEKRRSDFKAVAKGAFVVTADVEAGLHQAGIVREAVVDLGIQFVRRTHSDGYQYFFANRSSHRVDGWANLGIPAKSAVLLDPRFESCAGTASLRHDSSGVDQVYLQLEPGESCILRTYSERIVKGPEWSNFKPAGEPGNLAGTWKVQFIDGGPATPAVIETKSLASWTTLGDDDSKRFAGTARYTIEFPHPGARTDDWVLDLGKVCESARVSVNGTTVGALWCAPFKIPVGKWLKPGQNVLEIEVTNLAANRIADMDRRKEKWKYFYDANLAPRKGRGVLDASQWPLMDSGLLGPVSLQPVNRLVPN